MKCLNTRPEHRYQNAGELAEELRRYADGEPITAKPISSFRRLLRWSRQQPGLAVTWLALITFSLYHLADVYLLHADVNPNNSDGWWFHKVAMSVAIIWSIGAYCFQKLLIWSLGALWPLFGWVMMEVVLLTLLLFSLAIERSRCQQCSSVDVSGTCCSVRSTCSHHARRLCDRSLWLRLYLPHLSGSSGRYVPGTCRGVN